MRDPVNTNGSGRPGIGSTALLILFLLALALPRLDMSLHIFPATDIAEKRKLADAPSFSWSGFPGYMRGYVRYFNDNFGLREHLVHLDNALRLRLLHLSPVSKLIFGLDGWIFYNSDKVPDGITISDYKGLAPYSPGQLEKIKAAIRGREEWCRQRGIKCLFVIVPNKETIYPEYLPPSVRRRVGRQTRLDQVTEALRDGAETISATGVGAGAIAGDMSGSDGPVVDLRPALLRAKEECPYPIYNRGGTHWNEYGAYYAYCEILRVMAKRHGGLRPYAVSDFKIETDPASSEDHWLGMKENITFRFKLKPTAARVDAGGGVGKVVVIYDSFWDALEPFFALHFTGMATQHVNVAKDSSLAIIEREKPVLVIYEVAERYADALWGSF
jgi:hypothetical protein